MAVCLQVLGLILGIVSWCLQSSSTSSLKWKVRSQAETVTSSSWQFEGLWMSCAATSLGSVQCSRFKTVLGLPAHLQACRALMIISLILGLASIVVTVLGLKCTKIGRTSEKVKEQIALSGGLLFILSGVFSLVAVSWFELGTGLFLGWTASGLAILGGSLLCYTCRRSSSTPPARQFSFYSNTSGGQSIYKAAPAFENSSSKAYV
ncbi:claudin-19-like isoform X2 [Girardinichthys multiradiatus]|uniref:claudin-19-like isoform X2 n=1 Tax=Girardinichthys multiradiatus TaxID=208333 RepID=UPI001FAC64DD|nr:claudin-19-like isoform X2 [Girardinichthys multiradiatus]